MKPFIARLCDESNSLSAQIYEIEIRLERLVTYKNKEILKDEQLALLNQQEHAMHETVAAIEKYQEIVDKRIVYELNNQKRKH